MVDLSYSPSYQQSVIWVAEYDDGSLLREWDDSGKENSFRNIDKSKLRKFHLVSESFDYYFDCQTGVFTINDIKYVFPLAGEKLNFAEGLIHFKDATTEMVLGKKREYDGFEINGYEFGWKVTHDNIKSQVIFELPSKIFIIEITFLDLQKTILWKINIKSEGINK